MPHSYCPLCGSGTIQTSHGKSVCLSCEASVQRLNMVTVVRPRPAVTAS